MILKTNKGNTFFIDWMWGPVGLSGELMMQYQTSKTLKEIAEEFEGCNYFETDDENEGHHVFEDWDTLTSIDHPNYKEAPNMVRLTFQKR